MHSGGKLICGLDYRRESRETACFIQEKNMDVVMGEQKYSFQFVRPEVVLWKSTASPSMARARKFYSWFFLVALNHCRKC